MPRPTCNNSLRVALRTCSLLLNSLDCLFVCLFVCLFGLRLYVPVNNFSVISGRSHRFMGITSTFWEVNVSCSRIQHVNLSED